MYIIKSLWGQKARYTRALKRPKKTPRGLSGGFSVVEMLVVIIIMGILIVIAVPTYMSIVPSRELKADARAVMNAFQKARMSASIFQRPIRVLLDCTNA
ncbi:MAG: prepilin-type N-terminal cleavage/methylation domain-containing protein, partial [Deltaproteobacteria bacterium]|nr:prepilin-type N-terminal cleavage/methylation domain-containing protein [Deltaproteobacteria bacterium]